MLIMYVQCTRAVYLCALCNACARCCGIIWAMQVIPGVTRERAQNAIHYTMQSAAYVMRRAMRDASRGEDGRPVDAKCAVQSRGGFFIGAGKDLLSRSEISPVFFRRKL